MAPLRRKYSIAAPRPISAGRWDPPVVAVAAFVVPAGAPSCLGSLWPCRKVIRRVVPPSMTARVRHQQANRRGASGAPPANERRLVPDEVVIELPNSVSTQQVDALQRRFRLTRIESQTFQLTNTTLYRWRIPDRRSVATVVRALEGDRLVASAQPNYLFTLQEGRDQGAKAIQRNTNSPSCICRRRTPLPEAIM